MKRSELRNMIKEELFKESSYNNSIQSVVDKMRNKAFKAVENYIKNNNDLKNFKKIEKNSSVNYINPKNKKQEFSVSFGYDDMLSKWVGQITGYYNGVLKTAYFDDEKELDKILSFLSNQFI